MTHPLWLSPFIRVWASRAPRERRLLGLGALVVGLYLLWVGVWQPSWQVLSQASARESHNRQVMAQLQQLQTQAQTLRTQPAPAPGERLAAATALAQAAGAQAQPTPQGLRVTVQAWTPAQLARWLTDLHETLHLSPSGGDLQQQQGQWSGWLLIDTGGSP